MARSWTRFLSRFALATVSLLVFLSLMGCEAPYGTLYDDKWQIPIIHIGVDPLLLVVGIIVFGLLGPAVTVVLIGLLLPFVFPPAYRIKVRGMTIELWESRRRYPFTSFAQALVVPVAPDLKMVSGAAKLIRDWGAGKIQAEANKVAPLPPGEAFVGEGARWRYKFTVLAVIFDEQKRTSPELMIKGFRRAFELLSQEEHVGSVLIPDMTENLLAQPNWITDEQRDVTARQTARLMLTSLLACRDQMRTVKIWVWDPNNTEAFIAAMEQLEEEEAETPMADETSATSIHAS
jgi:hypothetical protein